MSTLKPLAVGTARPEILASPTHAPGASSGGLTDGLCSASRGVRCKSASLREPGIEPKVTSFSIWVSMPLMRGEPSARSVAIVLCLRAWNSARTRAANSGASASICCHATMDVTLACHTDNRRHAVGALQAAPKVLPARAWRPRHRPEGCGQRSRSALSDVYWAQSDAGGCSRLGGGVDGWTWSDP